MVDQNGSGSVELAGGDSATVHLHRALTAAREAFPDALRDVELGASPDGFRRDFPDVLPRFEAARADSADRSAIAAALVDAARAATVWRTDDEDVPLADHVAGTAEPLATESIELPGSGRLRPRVPFDGDDLAGGELVDAVHALVDRGSASNAVADGITWIVDHRDGDGGIDLSDRRIVVLGAGAELAPTRLWLEGGADVLWIDLADPQADVLESTELSGRLRWVPGGADLLAAPDRIRATIEEFAGDDAIDVGLYAYSPGRAREWRLTRSMNAIVDALPPGLVRGVATLVSPTTCGVLTPDDLDGEARRRAERSWWHAVLDRVGLLGRGAGHAQHGDTCANRGIVSIQGGSYQAAQYLGKLMAAEAWATREPAIAVSANTAGISLTESLQHPVFDTAFSGADALGVETFDPPTTAHLNGLLTLHDRLDPRSGVEQLFDARVHGGIYQLPYPIDPALRVAAGIGVAKDPRRVVTLVRRN